MGDGNINTQKGRNSLIEVEMVAPNYLHYLDEKFGKFGTGVRIRRTAEEKAKLHRNTEFRPNAQSENYSDSYRWRSRSIPELNEFRNWYSTGEKVWPDNINLTPIVLKHWYCGDGHFHNSNSHKHIIISMENEVENTEKLNMLFENAKLPAPNNYNIYERQEDGGKACKAEFTKSQSKELWEYMGEALPDFEYKWPKEYRQT